MNTYTVTFFDENDGDPEDVEIREVTVSSAVAPDDLAAGDWDAHELLVRQAREKWSLTDEWEPSHVTFSDGEVAQVPAGL